MSSSSSSSPSMIHYMGKLTITVHQAKDLKNVKLIGTMDPYAKVELKSEHFKTKVHGNGGSFPRWEQSFIFNVDAKGNDLFHIGVYSSASISDDKIGRASIELHKLINTVGKQWLQLADFANFNKMAGAIEITVEYAPVAGSAGSAGSVQAEQSKPSTPAAPTTSTASTSPQPAPVPQPVQPVQPAQPSPVPVAIQSPPIYQTPQPQPQPISYPPQPGYAAPYGTAPAYPPAPGYPQPYPTQPVYQPAPVMYSQPGYGAPPVMYQQAYASPPSYAPRPKLCNRGHPLVMYSSPPSPAYTHAGWYSCDICRATNLSFANTLWHCNICGQYDVCPGCASRM